MANYKTLYRTIYQFHPEARTRAFFRSIERSNYKEIDIVYIYIYIYMPRSWVRISLEAKYLQHLSAQLIHYIPPYLSTV